MLESILLVISLCIDALVASFAYGADKIKIPAVSTLLLTGISTAFLIISLTLGSIIKIFLPPNITLGICFCILFLLGLFRLFEGLLKNLLAKKAASPHNIEVKLFDFKLILQVYTDATLADLDHSKVLSPKEAFYLGIALSFDSLAVGFGAGLATINFLQIIIFSLLFNTLAILIGGFIGRKCAENLEVDLSWISGVTLIILAILKII